MAAAFQAIRLIYFNILVHCRAIFLTKIEIKKIILLSDKLGKLGVQVCQGTCLCAPSPEGYGKGKVLYCYGEVQHQHHHH